METCTAVVGSAGREGGVDVGFIHHEVPKDPMRISWCLSPRVVYAVTGGSIQPSKRGKLHIQSLARGPTHKSPLPVKRRGEIVRLAFGGMICSMPGKNLLCGMGGTPAGL